MSKQLKYKLKKTLKNAEFVHADLEYHQELSRDAIVEFQDEVNKLIGMLSPEDRQKINDRLAQQQPPREEAENHKNEDPPKDMSEAESSSLVPSDIEPEEAEEHSLPKINKAAELKKLFRRIAEHTHPDKVRASGFSEKEVFRLERIFMRARSAYDNENWYVLYCIAIQLGLEINDPTNEEIKWIEEDIKKTLVLIAKITNLVAWQWYIGTEEIKKEALKHYFLQIYGLTLHGL